ncbi:MAG: thioredoxin domain-containing protein [Deltaproteobacteria bacterium]|nr:thioredoxin domain-containing protein [Deltaproteobacteria bacterium]
MKNSIFRLFLLSFFGIVLTSLTLKAEIPGKYEIIPPNVPPKAHSLKQVHIIEVFSFTCPHCFTLNQQMTPIKEKFGDRIKVSYVPIGWSGHDPGRLLYIAEKKGKAEPVKDMIFDYYHIKGLGKSMYTRDKLQYVAKQNGLSDEFKTQMDAPDIIKAMNDGIAMTKTYGIDSTPTLVIENSILVSGNPSNFIPIINYLLKEPVQ